MSSREFAEWLGYARLHPLDQTDLLAQLLAMFANVYFRGKEAAFLPSDFLPDGNRQQRLAQGMAVMAQFAAHAAKKPD